MNKNDKVVVALIAGAAIGAVLGILFAPEKGSVLRKKLSEEGLDIPEQWQDFMAKGVEKLEKVAEDALNTFKDKLADLEEKL